MFIPLISFFIITDFIFIKSTFELIATVISRGINILILIPIIFILRKTSRPKTLDKTIIIFLSIMVTHILIVSSFAEYSNIAIIVWDIIVIIHIYTVVPTQLTIQIVIAIYLTIGEIIFLIAFKHTSWKTMEILSVFGAFMWANILGIFISHRVHKLRRKQFILNNIEQKIMEDLENALSEVKVLRGIIPICSFCKKIRNDEGYYEEVEEYISKNTDADFSHTICPECLKEYYPDVYKKS